MFAAISFVILALSICQGQSRTPGFAKRAVIPDQLQPLLRQLHAVEDAVTGLKYQLWDLDICPRSIYSETYRRDFPKLWNHFKNKFNAVLEAFKFQGRPRPQEYPSFSRAIELPLQNQFYMPSDVWKPMPRPRKPYDVLN